MNLIFHFPFLFLDMAFSKIFFGGLPEITNHIIQYLRNDLKTLHSCILVNRFLCRIVIPILWEDPFSVLCQEECPYKILDTYLSFFNENDKTKLKEFGITINLSSFNKPLFNYPSFIKAINTFRVELYTVNWINNLDHINSTHSTNSTNQVKSDVTFFPIYNIENTSLEIKKNLVNSKKAKDFICISLFKLFINNDASLIDLIITYNDYYGLFFINIYQLILDNPKFISNVKNFTLNCSKFDSIQHFLKSLASSLSSIRHLDIYINRGLSTENLANFIHSQTQLLSLSLWSKTITESAASLGAFMYCSDTLVSLMFFHCDFTKILSFNRLKYLTQLRSLQFISCKGLTTQVFQPLLDIPTLKIRSLKVIGQISGIDLLLQKFGSFLEHLELRLREYAERVKAFKSIRDHCDKLEFLYLYEIGYGNIPQLYNLIIHFNKHLKYLSLQNKYYWWSNGSIENNLKISSMILKELGQILPDSLEYLDLCLIIDPNALKIFLNNYKPIKLNKLLVKNYNEKNIVITFNILKEFVREKKVKMFAYEVGDEFEPDDLEHQNLKKLASEVQPFVKMKRYDDLVVGFFDIIDLDT